MKKQRNKKAILWNKEGKCQDLEIRERKINEEKRLIANKIDIILVRCNGSKVEEGELQCCRREAKNVVRK
jgi:hypothetical protein